MFGGRKKKEEKKEEERRIKNSFSFFPAIPS
jgi:hypothetical protein